MTRTVRMLIFTAFVAVFAVTVLAVCGDDAPVPATEEPEATEAPAATSAPTTAPPTAAPTAAPTATSAPTDAPTQAPAVAPTAEPEMPAMPAFEFSPDARWGDLIDTLSESEQECIGVELGDQLETARNAPLVDPTQTQQWEAPIFGCISQPTAIELFYASFAAQLPPLPPESEVCVKGLLQDVDIAALVASQTAAPDPATEAAAMQFGFGLLACLPPEMMAILMEGPGAGVPTDTGPTPGDDTSMWSFETRGWVVVAPTVVDGVVYAGSDDNSVYAIDAATGQEIWSYRTGGVIRSTPTVAGGTVYVGSGDSHVYALDAGTGNLLWRFNTGEPVYYSPVASEGRVYVVAAGETLYGVQALDAQSGATLWAAQVSYPYGKALDVTVANGRVFTPGDSGEFYALDASTGDVAWSFEAGLGAESPPAVVGGVVYLTAVNSAYALDEATGEFIWSYGTEMFPAMDRPAVVDGGVYYFAPDSHLYALNTETGHIAWYYVAESFIVDTPVVAQGLVYLSTESGAVDAVDASTGGFVWRWEMPDVALRSATVVNGFLIGESSDGYLRVLNAATGEEVWSFSKGYFDGVKSYTVDGGVLYVGALDGSVYAFAIPSAG